MDQACHPFKVFSWEGHSLRSANKIQASLSQASRRNTSASTRHEAHTDSHLLTCPCPTNPAHSPNGWRSSSQGPPPAPIPAPRQARRAWALWSFTGASLVKSKAVIHIDSGSVRKWLRVPHGRAEPSAPEKPGTLFAVAQLPMGMNTELGKTQFSF